MADDGGRDVEMKALARMIAYARGEAVWLRLSDVALLLAQAEDAVAALAEASSSDVSATDLSLDTVPSKH